jgi:RHS repeat-associated protein
VLTSYFGPFVREGIQGGTNNLKYILTPEGRIMKLAINELSTSSGTNNPYLYNNKELQPGFGLNWYNYIARFYDPEVPRFTGVDPLAVNYPWQSTYVYAAGNPIRYIDWMGLGPLGADELTDEEWMETSRPNSDSRMAREYRQQNLAAERAIADLSNFVHGKFKQNPHATVGGLLPGDWHDPVEGKGQGGNSLYAIGMSINAAGFISSGGEYSNVVYGNWRGANGKWYPTRWGGNQWTGARSTVMSRAGAFKLASRGFFVVGTGISLYQGGDALLYGDYEGASKSGLDIGMGAFATFGGPPGWIIGGGYFLLDAIGAFNRPVITIPYISPSYSIPDKTYVVPPIIKQP